jgi:D-glycero-beta-D-manno-heptose 1-phosphate adenylyltransferase
MQMDYHKIIEQKIFQKKAILQRIKVGRDMFNQKFVFTNGCFDILHKGHADYLAKTRSLGDFLIVGLNTDASVKRQNKAPGRPVNDELSRAFVLASLHVVDAVVLFDEDTPYELIKAIQPDVLVKGADYKPEDIVGGDVVRARGGEVVTIELTEGFSTSRLIEKIKS